VVILPYYCTTMRPLLQLGKTKRLIDDLIHFGSIFREKDGGFGKYPCARNAGYQLVGNLVNEASSDDAPGGGMLVKHMAVLSTLCNGLCVNYIVHRRAESTLGAWVAAGLRPMKSQAVAAAAIWHAHVEEKSFFVEEAIVATHVLKLARLASYAGVSPETVRRVILEAAGPVG